MWTQLRGEAIQDILSSLMRYLQMWRGAAMVEKDQCGAAAITH